MLIKNQVDRGKGLKSTVSQVNGGEDSAQLGLICISTHNSYTCLRLHEVPLIFFTPGCVGADSYGFQVAIKR